MSAGVISSAALNKGGDSLLESVIGSLLQGIPSKKNSLIHKKIKLLKKRIGLRNLYKGMEIYFSIIIYLEISYTKRILKIY